MIVATDSVLNQLVILLTYPEADYLNQAERARAALAGEYPPAARYLGEFFQAVGSFEIEQLQELFIQAFDLNPICALEVGWQLYGDEYKRGEFLVKMRQMLNRFDLPPSTELPDHMARVLPLLERLSPAEAEPLARDYIVPALGKMLAGMEGKRNPFDNVLKAVQEILHQQVTRHFEEARHD